MHPPPGRLRAHADRELAPVERVRCALHLRRCAACRREASRQARDRAAASAALSAAAPVVDAAEGWARIVAVARGPARSRRRLAAPGPARRGLAGPGAPRLGLAALAGGTLALGALVFLWARVERGAFPDLPGLGHGEAGAAEIQDLCCWDVDGGGPGDDGVLTVTLPGERVIGLAVYEDRNGSRSLSRREPLRFAAGGALPDVTPPGPAGPGAGCTGNFLVLNTGEKIVRSERGLLTTVGYKFGDAPAVYAMEGSIAVTGSAVQWLRDQLGIIEHSADIESLAMHVPDNGGVAFVPAFSGLFAPYWRPDARGAIVGLSRFNTKEHLARATLESICHQSADVVAVMVEEADLELGELKVDGGITQNILCMQIQADLLGVDVVRPEVAETTALGAAYAAGLAVGFWKNTDELAANWAEGQRWTSNIDQKARDAARAHWAKAVERSLDWV